MSKTKKKKKSLRRVSLVIVLFAFSLLLLSYAIIDYMKSNQKSQKDITVHVINDKKIKRNKDEAIRYAVKEDVIEKDGVSISYKYPVFEAVDEKYSEVVRVLNKKYEDLKASELEDEYSIFRDNDSQRNISLGQKIDNIEIKQEDEFLYVMVNRTQEVGGPHPNNYSESYVIDCNTYYFAKMREVINVNDDTINEIAKQVSEEHPERDFKSLRNDIKKAINQDSEHWEIRDGKLVIWFDVSDISGAYSGDGEFAAIIPYKKKGK